MDYKLFLSIMGTIMLAKTSWVVAAARFINITYSKATNGWNCVISESLRSKYTEYKQSFEQCRDNTISEVAWSDSD